MVGPLRSSQPLSRACKGHRLLRGPKHSLPSAVSHLMGPWQLLTLFWAKPQLPQLLKLRPEAGQPSQILHCLPSCSRKPMWLHSQAGLQRKVQTTAAKPQWQAQGMLLPQQLRPQSCTALLCLHRQLILPREITVTT